MSTTTNFKRIALVAVAALGLGVLSSVPSQAVGNVVVTLGGTATTAAGQSDSTTAATISITGTIENVADTITVSFVGNGTLGDSVTASQAYTDARGARLSLLETTTAARTQVDTVTAGGNNSRKNDSITATGTIYLSATASAGNIGAKFGLQLDSATGQVAGTYSFLVFVRQYTAGVALPVTNSYSVSLVSAAPASASATASSEKSTALLYGAGTWATTATDSTVAVAGKAKADGTPSAAIKVDLLNAGSGQSSVRDSITVTIDKGNASIGTANPGTAAQGKSLVPYSYVGSTVYVHVYPDGSSGVATLTIKTLNAGTFTKSITFVGTTIASINAAQRLTVIAVGTEASSSDGTAVRSQVLDANSYNFASLATVYAYSSDTTVISNYGTACTYNKLSSSDNQWYNYCPLTGLKAGTANITLRDAATVADSKVTSNAVAVRVSAGVATSVTMTTDKASYTPGEKGYLLITVKDAAGLVMPAGTYTNLFTSSGIQYSNGVSIGAIGTTAVAPTISKIDTVNGTVTYTGNVTTATGSWTTARSSSGTTSPSSNDPIAYVLFYAPTASGSFTFTATGGSSLPVANQVAVTASASVADNASAALAAVSALAVTVASLKTLITTLTNLVLKIQKKVKA
jgi:hypothetical protein